MPVIGSEFCVFFRHMRKELRWPWRHRVPRTALKGVLSAQKQRVQALTTGSSLQPWGQEKGK